MEKQPFDLWHHAVRVSPNKFTHKSLSDWSLNVAVGCAHGCSFCYVPSASTIKMRDPLAEHGVKDPDLEWGEYAMVRPFDTAVFDASMRRAENTARAALSFDGNRAVMMSTTTDPYQVIRHPNAARRAELNAALEHAVRRSLQSLLLRSTLNVRVLTRGPLAARDFDLMRQFGDRLVFGMSLPTTRADLTAAYEAHAPSPAARLRTLRAAKDAGLNVYVAMAPTYPECDRADIRRTMAEIATLEPLTVFHEPINIRRENARRIADGAQQLGVQLDTAVFESTSAWRHYARNQFQVVEQEAAAAGLGDRLHLWPDATLGSRDAIKYSSDTPQGRAQYSLWLDRCWSRVSEWPGVNRVKGAAR
jgi:DNA repair photolyase